MVIVLRIGRLLLELQGVLRHSGTPRYYLAISIALVVVRLLMIPWMFTIVTASEIDNIKRMEAIPLAVGGISFSCNAIYNMVIRPHIAFVLSNLQSHIDNKKPFKLTHFMFAQRISERLSKYMCVGLWTALSVYSIYPVINGAYLQLSGSNRPNQWMMPIDVPMPFEIETPLGYLMGVGSQMVYLSSSSTFVLVSQIIYFGGCLFSMSYVDDLRDFYRHLDEEYARSNNRRELRHNLIKAVHMHLIFTEWFEHFAQIASGFIFFDIVGSAITTSASIYLCMKGHVLYLLHVVWWLVEVFSVCCISTIVTQKILATGDTLYDLHWYSYPVPLQRFVILAMQQMQRAEYLNGFGIIDCSLKFFSSYVNFLGTFIAVLQTV